MDINKICVLGLGYFGLPTASLLANNGFNGVKLRIYDPHVKEFAYELCGLKDAFSCFDVHQVGARYA